MYICCICYWFYLRRNDVQIIRRVSRMDKVYDVFIDDYISREDMELNAPPERYIEITSDLLIKNAARWFIEGLKESE